MQYPLISEYIEAIRSAALVEAKGLECYVPLLYKEVRKKRKNQLSESSEIEKNGNCIGNNPVLEAFYANKNNSTEPSSNIFLSPKAQLKAIGSPKKKGIFNI